MSTLINPTWWLLCAALVLCVGARDPRRALHRGLRWATATPVLALIACAATANLGTRAMLGHAVPGDFAQEVVAARSMRSHSTLYPPDVNEAVRAWLAADPPVLPPWLPGPVTRLLAARRQSGRNSLVAQAHPPTLLLAAAPAILVLGAQGGYWALTIVSIAAAVLTAALLVSALAPAASGRERLLATLALVSWQPVLATVRDGQVSVVIGALLVLAWSDLRRGRDARAGAAIGAAAALKLYPLLLLVLMALRRRGRACAVAAAVLAGAAATVAIVLGPRTWVEFSASARVIAWSFAQSPYNLSLVPRLDTVVPGSLIAAAYPAIAAAALVVTLLVLRRGGGAPLIRPFDVEFAAVATLALLFSPVAWHHYVFMLALPLIVVVADAWASGRRAPLAWAVALAAILSLPDDVWRAVWWGMPARLALVVSPGSAVVLLWAALLRVGGRAAPGVGAAESRNAGGRMSAG